VSEIAVIDHEPHMPQASATLFGTDDPQEIVERAAKVADALADVVKKKNLVNTISGREHVRVEGWTLLGSMLGVFPVVVWTRPVGQDEGWEARVEARTRDGGVIGAAESECLRSEKTWARRDSYALRSMAQTRATSKALRQPLGFVMVMSGFEAIPEEELPGSQHGQRYEGVASFSEWEKGMLDLGVGDAAVWAREAIEKAGVTEGKLIRLNSVLAALRDMDYDAFGTEAKTQLQAAFAVAFDGVLVEGPAPPDAEMVVESEYVEDPDIEFDNEVGP
jgi:hypothetical protein